MSSFALKLIAMVTMLIDHIGAVLIPMSDPSYEIIRIIGRIAFPIYVFMLVEGFYHTKNINKYLFRLGIFALISEIPFDLAFHRSLGEFNYQNIFFTLFIGLGMMYLMSIIETRFAKNILASNFLDAVVLILACLVAEVLRVDYGAPGIILIAVFYLFRKSKFMLTLMVFVVLNYYLGGISIFGIASLIFIFLYNGKKGKEVKYLFYGFYPVHLLVLFGISLLIR